LRIRLNGDPHELTEPLTLLQLLQRLDIDPRIVAVEHNLTIVKRDRLATTTVNEGDEVEIVRFVGGGSSKTSNS
jgi:thiamine biosynthesis protein ThiS